MYIKALPHSPARCWVAACLPCGRTAAAQGAEVSAELRVVSPESLPSTELN